MGDPGKTRMSEKTAIYKNSGTHSRTTEISRWKKKTKKTNTIHKMKKPAGKDTYSAKHGQDLKPHTIVSMASATVETCQNPETGEPQNTTVSAEANFAAGIARQVMSCPQGSLAWAGLVELYRAAKACVDQHEKQEPETAKKTNEDPLKAYPEKETTEDLRKAE